MTDRLHLLPILLQRPHRFRRLRVATATLSLAALAAVPLTGLARLDLVSGRHLAFGAPAGPERAAVAVVASIALFYLVTFVVNLVGGRLFCGFGCPLAYATRLAEEQAAAAKHPGRRRRAVAARALYGALFGAALALWFVDPLAAGLRSAGAAFGLAAAIGAALHLHGARWGWRFCREWCPIGLYYTVVTPTKSFEIHFDRGGPCISCDACDAVCPVGLPPRDLAAPVERAAGLAPGGAPGYNHCLSCGDCVEACEHATRKLRGKLAEKAGGVPVAAPLTFGWTVNSADSSPQRTPGS